MFKLNRETFAKLVGNLAALENNEVEKFSLCCTSTPLVLSFQNTHANLCNLPDIKKYVSFLYNTQEMKHMPPSKHQ